jgi:hypothetical protein
MRGGPGGGTSCSLLKKEFAARSRLTNNYPACDGIASDRYFFSVAGRPRLKQVLEVWILTIPERRECKGFPLKTGIRYDHVPFKTGFA